MAKVQARRRKTTGSNKRITSEQPLVECKMLCPTLYEWKIENLRNLPTEEQKRILGEKLDGFKTKDNKQGAAFSLLEIATVRGCEFAALLAVKEKVGKLNVGFIANKYGFKQLGYSASMEMLKRVVTYFNLDEISDTIKNKLKAFCQQQAPDNTPLLNEVI